MTHEIAEEGKIHTNRNTMYKNVWKTS